MRPVLYTCEDAQRGASEREVTVYRGDACAGEDVRTVMDSDSVVGLRHDVTIYVSRCITMASILSSYYVRIASDGRRGEVTMYLLYVYVPGASELASRRCIDGARYTSHGGKTLPDLPAGPQGTKYIYQLGSELAGRFRMSSGRDILAAS